MIHGELLVIEPSEIKFTFELKKEISCTLHLSNFTEFDVSYKVLSTSPKKYWVQPKTGFIPPRSSCDIIVYMQEQNEVPSGMLCTDKFMIQSIIGTHFPKPGEEFAPLIKDSRRVYEHQLNVVYIHPHQQSPLLNVRSKSVASRQSLAEEEEEDWSGYEVTRAVSDIKDRLSETCIGKLLKIVPSQLQFPFGLNIEMSCSIRLSNITEHHVAFKMKTTNPRQYSVRPNMGIILPHSTCDITVRMQAQKEAPTNMLCKDKFVLQSIIVIPSTAIKDINSEMFKKTEGSDVEDYIFPVVFIVSPLLSVQPVKELGGFLDASSIKNENFIGSQSASFGDDEMSIGDLLTVKPLELKFPFELNKRVSCFLHLTNTTEKDVVFKVRATSPAKYTVQPSAGFISPRSKLVVVVTLLPHKKAPPDIQNQEKFLIQCLVTNPGSISKEAIRELFTKDASNVKECKMRVAFIPPLSEPSVPFLVESTSDQATFPLQNDQLIRIRSQSLAAEQDKQSNRVEMSVSEEGNESSSVDASGETNDQSISVMVEPEEMKDDHPVFSEIRGYWIRGCEIFEKYRIQAQVNGRPINCWVLFWAVIVLVGVLSSYLNGNVMIKMIPMMMKTLIEMISDMIGDWVVKALVVVCFQLIFGYHMNNN